MMKAESLHMIDSCPLRVRHSVHARSSNGNVATVTHTKDRDVNVEKVFKTTTKYGYPIAFEVIDKSCELESKGISVIDSTSNNIIITLPVPQRNGTEKEIVLLYGRSNPVTLVINIDEQIVLSNQDGMYVKLFFHSGKWIRMI